MREGQREGSVCGLFWLQNVRADSSLECIVYATCCGFCCSSLALSLSLTHTLPGSLEKGANQGGAGTGAWHCYSGVNSSRVEWNSICLHLNASTGLESCLVDLITRHLVSPLNLICYICIYQSIRDAPSLSSLPPATLELATNWRETRSRQATIVVGLS